MDRARQKVDKILSKMEKDIHKLYNTDEDIRKTLKNLDTYMQYVKEETAPEYEAYKSEHEVEKRRELKKIYSDKVESLTLKSKEYKELRKNYVQALSKANQRALDIVNDKMAMIYAESYNQVAVACRRVGIKVNG